MYNDQQIDVAAIGGGSDMHEYSTTEKEVGTWIDGSKVYEKSFYFENKAGVVNDWTSLEAVADVDKVINFDGGCKSRTNGQYTCLGFYIQYCFVGGYVKYFSNTFNNTNIDLFITMRYTKTA